MVAQLGIKTTCNQSMAAIIPDARLHPRHLYWWLVANYQNIRNLAGGEARDGLNLDLLGAISCPLPPFEEQQVIARFLDTKTAQIDTLVTKKRELIAKLKEKRSALIARTVTRGLPPEAARAAGLANPKMKDSEVEWLGEIPTHWHLLPLFRIADEIQTGPFGSQLHQADYVEDEIPLINPIHLVDGELRPDDKNTVTLETAERLIRYRLLCRDIVFARRGEIGRCAVVRQNQEGWVCGTGSMLVRLKNVDADYFSLIFRSSGFSSLLELSAVGTTMLNLSPSIIGRMRVPVPPLLEQQAIVAYLRSETIKLDQLTTEVETAIACLIEYRQALITSAVTGKIDVREAA
jgi:type I restriction enzyme S subunit